MLSTALAIACIAGVSAQEKPNFAGTGGRQLAWTLLSVILASVLLVNAFGQSREYAKWRASRSSGISMSWIMAR